MFDDDGGDMPCLYNSQSSSTNSCNENPLEIILESGNLIKLCLLDFAPSQTRPDYSIK